MADGRRTELKLYQVDAFARRPFEGNPAAILPLDSWLPDATMQAIAMENNLSETAFTVPSSNPEADYDLRWFTPTVEVDLCGHATLASGHLLIGKRDAVRFATRSGILTVERGEDGLILDLPATMMASEDVPGLCAALGVEAEEVALGQGGNGALIVRLKDEAAVRAVAPDFRALKAFDSLVIVTAEGEETDVVSRVFATYHGIDEDPVTGSAHAALTPFWAARLGRERFTAFQASQRGGHMTCQLAGDRVRLAASCVTVIKGHLCLDGAA